MRRAVIDIGTNTVKLLVADLAGNQIGPVSSKDRSTRLGEGLNESKKLSPAAIERTAQAVAEFAAEANALGAAGIRALTTEAARDADNRTDFLDAVRRTCGLDVEVVAAEQEAGLIFRGVCTDPAWAREPILVLDVGGGSAEFIAGQAGNVERYRSLPLGAVRLAEKFPDEKFPGLVEFLRTSMRENLRGFDLKGRRMIGSGGTITALAAIEHGAADHVALLQQELRALLMRLFAMPLAERRKVPGLPPDRADIIVAGGMVFISAMEALGAVELTVSTRGLRYGALL
jgi:exopolyphosphatase/guanosine-5'-triphosphate,3'-diphosphate pyrophosphatase